MSQVIFAVQRQSVILLFFYGMVVNMDDSLWREFYGIHASPLGWPK